MEQKLDNLKHLSESVQKLGYVKAKMSFMTELRQLIIDVQEKLLGLFKL